MRNNELDEVCEECREHLGREGKGIIYQGSEGERGRDHGRRKETV